MGLGKTVSILQPGYLPWLGYFEQLWYCDTFVVYDDVQFEKGSWRNRNRIKINEGTRWLTVPVSLPGHFPAINQVRIDYGNSWQKKQIRTLTQNYGRTDYFDLYADGLFQIMNRSYKYLKDLLLEQLYWFTNCLNIDTPILLSSDLNISGKGTRRLVDIVSSLSGNCFYEGASGRSYIESHLFEKRGISIEYQDYHHPVYPQCSGSFTPYLSIIDLMFNCGPKSLTILTNS